MLWFEHVWAGLRGPEHCPGQKAWVVCQSPVVQWAGLFLPALRPRPQPLSGEGRGGPHGGGDSGQPGLATTETGSVISTSRDRIHSLLPSPDLFRGPNTPSHCPHCGSSRFSAATLGIGPGGRSQTPVAKHSLAAYSLRKCRKNIA